jgi:putative ABC transport system permease protein
VVSLRFVVTKGLLNSSESQLESDNTNYTIIGVLNDDSQPIVYAPIQKIMAMGVTNYSGLKVIVKNQDSVTNTRIQIESLGLDTASVIDTIKQVTDLFSTVRLVLASIGMVALVVASLGMFNTLTISLLERTHEIGLMKTMGMKSFEIYKLFLSESLVIGVLGGFFGLILGFLAGKLLSITLSLIVINKNVGYIDVSQIPLVLVALVGVLSLIVGVFTGIYPAKRATRISALDALRYE